MKKLLTSLVVLSLASIVLAGELQVTDVGSFGTTKSGAGAIAEDTIPPHNGVIRNDALFVDVVTNANITIYRPSTDSKAAAASSASTTVKVYTSASNNWGGITPTTSDFILVDSSTSAGWQMGQISTIGAYATNVQTYVLSSNITCSVKDKLYFVDADDNVVFPGNASADQSRLGHIFTGKRDMPVHIRVPAAAGTSVIGGTYEVLR